MLSKSIEPARVPRVRIPPSPPNKTPTKMVSFLFGNEAKQPNSFGCVGFEQTERCRAIQRDREPGSRENCKGQFYS